MKPTLLLTRQVLTVVLISILLHAPANAKQTKPDDPAHHEVEIIESDLYVLGVVDVKGASLGLGVHDDAYGVGLFYDDIAADALRFRLRRPGAWLWENFDGVVSTPRMRLEANGRLSLYANGTPAVSLDPATKSLALGDVSLYRDSTGVLRTVAPFAVDGSFSAAGFTSTVGSLTGGPSGLSLYAGGNGDQDITLVPSGGGAVRLPRLQVGRVDRFGEIAVTGVARDNFRFVGLSGITTFETALAVQAGVFKWTSNNGLTEVARLNETGALLLGTPLDTGNGRLQLAPHQTRAGGIGFGEIALHHDPFGNLAVEAPAAPALALVATGGRASAIRLAGSAHEQLQMGAPVGTLPNAANVRIPLPAASVSATTGALVVDGGAGIGGSVNVGGSVTAADYTANAGVVRGGASGLALHAGGGNQDVTLVPAGGGVAAVDPLAGTQGSTMRLTARQQGVPFSALLTATPDGALFLQNGAPGQSITFAPRGPSGYVNIQGAGDPSLGFTGATYAQPAAVTLTQAGGHLELRSAGGNIALYPGTTGAALLDTRALILQNDDPAAGDLIAQILSRRKTADPAGYAAAIQLYRGAGMADGQIVFATNPGTTAGQIPVERLRITGTGNVGIGTATPGALLEVAGTVKAAGALTVTGPARFDGPVRIAPQGDISMGEFTAEPQP